MGTARDPVLMSLNLSAELFATVVKVAVILTVIFVHTCAGPLGKKNPRINRENYLSILSKHGRRCSILDRKPVLNQYAAGSCHAIVCQSDDEVLDKTVKEVFFLAPLLLK